VPEVPQNIHSVERGDIWQLGEHRLMCGDSTVVADVTRLMDGQKADFIYMDPPYGMNLNTNYARTNCVEGNSYSPVIGDDKDFDPRFFFNLFIEAREHFWWGADYYCQHLPKGGAWVVWDKKKDDLDDSIGTGFELCWSKIPHKRMMARFLWSGFTAKERNELRVHPTQKPIALHEWFFTKWGKENDLVVDLFLGSGSTLIACEKTGRKCFGMELDKHYCSVIIERWQQFTGKKAEKIA
jgi:DNA modification methylase